jgi:hypothetical protein
MAKYNVNITETSYGFVEVVADSINKARDKAEEAFYKGNVIWESIDFLTQEITECREV